MAKRQYTTIVVMSRERLNDEYRAAFDDRMHGPNVRIIGNPAAAPTVKAVIDQIPRVKAELAAAETAS